MGNIQDRLDRIEANQKLILELLRSKNIPQDSIINDDTVDEEEEQFTLPLNLRRPNQDMTPLKEAIRKKYITVAKDGKHLQSHFPKKVHLAYFCGRMWCDDEPYFDEIDNIFMWAEGDLPFPGTALDKLFGELNLKTARSPRLNCKLPDLHEFVDELFE